MNTHSRPVPLLLTALVAFFSALAALAVSGGMNMASAHGPATAEHSSVLPTPKSMALHDGMRKLWEDHITWTRLAIIGLEDDRPDADAAVARLLRNQTDIGNAIKPYYGTAAGNGLTKELRQHILIAADVIAAAEAGDATRLSNAKARWTANANRIAAVLHYANSRQWPMGALRAEMGIHLRLTTAEAVAHLQKRWNADVAAYDRVHVHILHMSDMLADGIVRQFPDRFRDTASS